MFNELKLFYVTETTFALVFVELKMLKLIKKMPSNHGY